MDVTCTAQPLPALDVDTLVVFVPKLKQVADRTLKDLNTASNKAVTALVESGEFTGAEGELGVIMRPLLYQCRRVLLAGLGERKSITEDTFRRAAGRVSRQKGLASSKAAAFHLGHFEDRRYFKAVVEGLLLGSHQSSEFKTEATTDAPHQLDTLTMVVINKRLLKQLSLAVERGRVVAEGQILARKLAAAPANRLTPKTLAQEAQKLAGKHHFRCTVLDEKSIAQEKMGALLAVGRGSAEISRFIILEYRGGPKGRRPVVLVGKGITFDSGGISLKPGLNMHEMKGDMSGAAAVLATFVTVARLKLPMNLVGLIPAAENMPSGRATKPGDIVTSRKGLTIEIINTDAEGRLILADALDYANKFDPQAVLDIATLTGGTLYVLGYSGAPIIGNNQALTSSVQKAAESTAERVWPLPIWDDHRKRLKSIVADTVNTAGRPAGTIVAAAFLEKFIGDWPWLHIDMAYVDVEPDGKPYLPKGVTGFGVRLLTEVLSSWKRP